MLDADVYRLTRPVMKQFRPGDQARGAMSTGAATSTRPDIGTNV
jgi:hypothetical protein